jgi:predicted MFS family arabinose efflux permease
MALIMLGLPIGTLVGALGAGIIAEHFGWRAAFFAFGVPGLIVALLTWRGLTEPPRGLSEGGTAERGPIPPLREVFAHLWRVRTLRYIVIGGSICSIGIQGVAQFMVLYLVRTFGLPISTAGAVFGLLSGASLAVGLLVGGLGTDRASGRDARWWVLGPAFALVITAVAFNVGFRTDALAFALALIALGNIGAMIHYGPTIGLIQKLTPVNMRSSAAAVFAMFYALAGTGIGPTFVGFMSDRRAGAGFEPGDYINACRPGSVVAGLDASCSAAARYGLIEALALCVLAYAVAALFYALASRTLRKDLAASLPKPSATP